MCIMLSTSQIGGTRRKVLSGLEGHNDRSLYTMKFPSISRYSAKVLVVSACVGTVEYQFHQVTYYCNLQPPCQYISS